MISIAGTKACGDVQFSAFRWGVELGTDRHQHQKNQADEKNDKAFDDHEPLLGVDYDRDFIRTDNLEIDSHGMKTSSLTAPRFTTNKPARSLNPGV